MRNIQTQQIKSCLIAFIIIFLLFPSKTINAEIVDTTMAKNVAINFYQSHFNNNFKSASFEDFNLLHTEFDNDNLKSTQKKEAAIFYVFQVEKEKGFIIISAENNTIPILGYSFTNPYSKTNQPSNYMAWMKRYKTQIRLIRDMGIKADSTINQEWNKYESSTNLKSVKNINAIAPLLKEIKWNQNCLYNYNCPDDVRGPCEKVYAGCVAVAMAQILKYHNYPVQNNSIPEYQDKINKDDDDNEILGSNYGIINGLPPLNFQWENMADNLSSEYGPPNVPPIAELIHYCGVSVKMNYGPYSSGAYSSDVKNALISFFKYKSSLRLIWKESDGYSDSDWNLLLRNELNNGRPIYYRGEKEGAHAFVIDGYEGTRHFNINWGWGGSNNGYFYLYDLTPGNSNYNDLQGAIIGIEPMAESDDITIENQQISKSNVCREEQIEVTCDQVYSGTTKDDDMDSPNVGFYLSTNTTFGSSDIYLDNKSSSIGSDDTRQTETETVTIPATVQNGNYYILFVADYLGEIDEDNEDNNVKYSPITVSCGVSNELFIENQSISKSTLSREEEFKVTCDQVYSGTIPNSDMPGPYLGYYISSNTTLGSSDILIGQDRSSIGSDVPRETENETVSIPSTIQDGNYYILFVADHLNEFDEDNENNNIAFVPVTISGDAFDEIYIENPTVSKSTVCQEEQFDVSCDMVYSGTTTDGNLTSPDVGYFLSVNATYDSSDILLGDDSSSIGSDDTRHAETQPVSIPSTVQDGDYYILFVADYLNDISESDENNNVVYVNIKINCGSENHAPAKTVLLTPGNGEKVFDSLNLSWTCDDDDGDNLTYEIQLGESSGNYSDGEALDEASLTIDISDDREDVDKTYYWRVRAYDGKDYGAYSNERSFIIAAKESTNTKPGIPTQLSPAANSYVTLPFTLSWSCIDDDGDNLTYQLYRRTQSGDWLLWASPTTNSYSVSTLEAGFYYWTVRAFDGKEYGDYATIPSFTVGSPNTVPNKPVIIAPANGSNVSLPFTLSWSGTDDDGDSLTYNIFKGLAPNDLNYWKSVPNNSYLVSKLEPGTYYWIVFSNDGKESSYGSDIFSFTVTGTSTNTKPNQPVLTSPEDGASFSNEQVFTWSGSDYDGDKLTYRFFLGTSSDNFQQSWDKENPTITLTSEEEDYGKTYYWKVAAFDGEDWSEDSEVRAILIEDPSNTPPDKPVLTSPENGITVSLPFTFTWTCNDNDNANSSLTYKIYKGTSTSNMTEWGSPNSPSFQGSSLSAGTYYWNVRAYDGKVWGSPSATRSFKISSTPINIPPEPPTLTYPGNGATVSPPFTLTWTCNDEDDANNSLTYKIYRGTSTGNMTEWTSSNTNTITANLMADGTYYWKVSAFDGQDWSDFSNTQSFIVAAGYTNHAPEKPVINTPSFNEVGFSKQFEISWTCSDPDDEDVLEYFVIISKGGFGLNYPFFMDYTQSKTISFDFSNVGYDYRGIWYGQVIATDGKDTIPSDIKQFELDWPVSAEIHPDKSLDIKVYPNPTDARLNIEFLDVPNKYNIVLYNNLGQMVLQKESENRVEELNLEKYISGIYYLKIHNKEFIKTEKIIVK